MLCFQLNTVGTSECIDIREHNVFPTQSFTEHRQLSLRVCNRREAGGRSEGNRILSASAWRKQFHQHQHPLWIEDCQDDGPGRHSGGDEISADGAAWGLQPTH